MATITNDSEFKAVLSTLTIPQQRQVAALFIDSAMSLLDDTRLQNALNIVKKTNVSAEELVDSYKIAKTASTNTFTHCGKNADWLSQAKHFVATAVTTALSAEEQTVKENNIAWHTAMQIRMARTCEMIASGETTENDNEANVQYTILQGFLQAT